jgi:hypothetical protein
VTEFEVDTYSPYIFHNALERVTSLNTFRVTGRIGKQSLFILVDSRSTHNFINTQVVYRLHCKLTNIIPLTMQIVNGGRMTCTSICKNFQ